MKKILLLLIFILSCSVIFTACTDDFNSPQDAYYMTFTYDFNNYKLLVVDDKENEQIIITHTALADDIEFKFDFDFCYNTLEHSINSDEFIYTDNLGSDIDFDKNGYYKFTGSRTFYVSYKNASEEIRNDILNDCYHIEVFTKIFSPYTPIETE